MNALYRFINLKVIFVLLVAYFSLYHWKVNIPLDIFRNLLIVMSFEVRVQSLLAVMFHHTKVDSKFNKAEKQSMGGWISR